MQRIAIFFALTNLSSPYQRNCRLVLLSWFPHYLSLMSCRTHPGNQPGPRGPWFPSTPPRHLSRAHPGNQVCREGGSGQLGTSGGQCRPGLQTARAGYAARHSGGRLSDGTARRLSSRLCPDSSSQYPSPFGRRLWTKKVEIALTFDFWSSCRTAIRHLFNEIADLARNDGKGHARNDGYFICPNE